ncbi:MAG: hypothetical protein IIU31_03190 [Pseudobutyrivibrio sp.]|nr:hypothetical protein [Pseudobutyrivibrio sp.]
MLKNKVITVLAVALLTGMVMQPMAVAAQETPERQVIRTTPINPEPETTIIEDEDTPLAGGIIEDEIDTDQEEKIRIVDEETAKGITVDDEHRASRPWWLLLLVLISIIVGSTAIISMKMSTDD